MTKAGSLGALLLKTDVGVQIKQDGITRLVVLPLYPQFSISTSASSLRLFEYMLQRDPQLQVGLCLRPRFLPTSFSPGA